MLRGQEFHESIRRDLEGAMHQKASTACSRSAPPRIASACELRTYDCILPMLPIGSITCEAVLYETVTRRARMQFVYHLFAVHCLAFVNKRRFELRQSRPSWYRAQRKDVAWMKPRTSVRSVTQILRISATISLAAFEFKMGVLLLKKTC